MGFNADVLQAMWQLAQRRQAATPNAVAALVTVPGQTTVPAARVQGALQRLEALGLADLRSVRSARLTMAGLAVAVATAQAGASRLSEVGAVRRGVRAPSSRAA